MDIAAQTEELVRGAVESEGYELVHAEFLDRGSASVLRVFIDKPGGVNLGDCQRISRHVSVLLDVEDLIDHHYTLEVSSPGLERPLFKAEDYLRFQGREVKLATSSMIENRRNFKGILKGFSDGVVTVDCGGKVFQIPLGQVKKANLVYRF